jgi:hypothetical protein
MEHESRSAPWVVTSGNLGNGQPGNHPQMVLGSCNAGLWSVRWSPNGQRLAYVRAHPGEQLMETCDLKERTGR